MFESGLRLASFGVGSALVMPLAGRLSDRWGSRNLALTGAAIALLSSFAFSRFDAQTDGFWPLLAAFTLGIGTGSAGAPVIGSVYRTLPGYLVPQGSSVLYTLNQLGASIGMSVVALLMLNAGTDPQSGFGGVGLAYQRRGHRQQSQQFLDGAGRDRLVVPDCGELLRVPQQGRCAQPDHAGDRLVTGDQDAVAHADQFVVAEVVPVPADQIAEDVVPRLAALTSDQLAHVGGHRGEFSSCVSSVLVTSVPTALPRWTPTRSSAGMPRSSQMTSSGTGPANVSIRSAPGPACSRASSCSPTTRRTAGARARTRLTVIAPESM